jgi:hypothetical protein
MLLKMPIHYLLRTAGSGVGPDYCLIRRLHHQWERQSSNKCKFIAFLMAWSGRSIAKRGQCAQFGAKLEKHIMDIANILKQSGAIGSIAQQLGVNEQVAEAGAAALLPAILGGFKKTTQAQAGGLEGLGGLLGQLGGGGLFDSVVSPEPTPVEKGNDVLGQIFGSKDVSRTVADHASGQTGIDPSLLKKMLPILAMLVAGYMAKQSGGGDGGGLGGLIGGMVGGGGQASGGGLGGMLGNVLGGALGGGQQAVPAGGGMGGLGSLLDMNGDGNPLDDIMGMAGKMMR